jgi:uncharacterized membrane protein
MKSHMTDSQFMVQVLHNLTNNYELQTVLMEKSIENKENLLSINEIQETQSLKYERMSFILQATTDIDLKEEKPLFTTQFKGM